MVVVVIVIVVVIVKVIVIVISIRTRIRIKTVYPEIVLSLTPSNLCSIWWPVLNQSYC